MKCIYGAYTFAGSRDLQSGSLVLGPCSNKTRHMKIRSDIGKTYMPIPIWQDPAPNKCSKGWQIISDPFARTQMLGPKCLDVKRVTMTNVHVLTKSTIGTLKHSFKSVDKGRLGLGQAYFFRPKPSPSLFFQARAEPELKISNQAYN